MYGSGLGVLYAWFIAIHFARPVFDLLLTPILLLTAYVQLR